MPKIVSNLVDTYLFRRVNARPQFLVLRRRASGSAPARWQSIHTRVLDGESAVAAARRDILAATGLAPSRMYTADYIAQFYDSELDAIVFAPAFAGQLSPRATPQISADFCDFAWCDLEETTARLAYSAQRWAVRHIYDVIAMSGDEAEIYAI